MIKGIGIDIIEIKRIEAAIVKNKGFLKRVFTDSELRVFEAKGFRVSSIAGFFAAKEACMKALGIGLRDIKWKDIEIKNDPLGKPYVVLHSNARELAYKLKIGEILLTISHSRENAVAHAIATIKADS